MFNVGPAEILVILVVALLVLGPQKLPDAARQLGKAMSEFRRVTSGLQDEVRGVLSEHLEDPPPVIAPPPAVVEPAPQAEDPGPSANGSAPESDGSSSTPTPPFLLE